MIAPALRSGLDDQSFGNSEGGKPSLTSRSYKPTIGASPDKAVAKLHVPTLKGVVAQLEA